MIFGSAKLISTRQLSMGISQAYTATEDDITTQNKRERPLEGRTWSLDVVFTGKTYLSAGTSRWTSHRYALESQLLSRHRKVSSVFQGEDNC
jgi:hypothetical protein